MKRAEYSDFGEPTVQVALRLPQSLVAAIDERRGNASRATFVALKMTEAMSPKPVNIIQMDPAVEQPCPHRKLVRGASGLLRCVDCGAIQR